MAHRFNTVLDVHHATESDWSAIHAIIKAVITTGDTYTLPPDSTESEARAYWMPHNQPRHETFVGRYQSETAATAILKPNHIGLGDHIANAAWMVDPNHAGKGIGRAFANYILEHAVKQGYTAMQFNAVVASNTRAIKLWESLHFKVIGKSPAAFRHARQGPTDLLIMHRDLVASPPEASTNSHSPIN